MLDLLVKTCKNRGMRAHPVSQVQEWDKTTGRFVTCGMEIFKIGEVFVLKEVLADGKYRLVVFGGWSTTEQKDILDIWTAIATNRKNPKMLQVGVKVRVHAPEDCSKHPCWVTGMERFDGKICTISRVIADCPTPHKHVCVELGEASRAGGKWVFNADWLEEVNED